MKAGRKRKIFLLIGLIGTILLLFCITPDPLRKPVAYSPVLLDRNGKMLQARIAEDGQWRFKPIGAVPSKFEKALLAFEDKRFYYHPGFDPFALIRAAVMRYKGSRSGGSTLTMQLVRIKEKNHKRNVATKLIEIWKALRIELSYSKREILEHYSSHAPFGGNVVGIEAAAWRYFGRSAEELSWAEAATLAILPNSPALIHPGKNRSRLILKRNRLLQRLKEQAFFSEEDYRLAVLEPIPDKPLPLPQHAPHLLASLTAGRLGETDPGLVKTTIHSHLQERVADILQRYHQRYSANFINNAAAIVLELESGHVLAYAGNVTNKKNVPESFVDLVTAARSPGSILKPVLYEAMLHDGLILPNTLIPDIPTQIAGYSPQNFEKTCDGAVPASRALARSLNIPAVRMLQQYRYERFYHCLKSLGISTLKKDPDHYGLSLILGGGENTLWELAGMYANLGRILLHQPKNNHLIDGTDIHPPKIFAQKGQKTDHTSAASAWVDAGSIYSTFEAMQELMRPGEEALWQQFSSSQRIAWKTGTSYGYRDGWAIGLTPRFVVAVWIGNATGEARPGLIGVQTAAPVMFDIFRLLPASNEWFPLPFDAMKKVPVCSKSGYRARPLCGLSDSTWISASGLKSALCPFHQLVHVDREEKWRVNSDCFSPSEMKHLAWFVLPPAMEWYYKKQNADYKSLPPFMNGCRPQGSISMEIIYPKRSNHIFIPVELDGKTGKCIFEVAHRMPHSRIHWHLDEEFIGSTQEFHQMALSPASGKHTLVLVDESGERLEQGFEIMAH